MSEGNGNNPGGVTSKAHSPVPNEDLGKSDRMARLKIFRGDAEGGEEVDYEIPPMPEHLASLVEEAKAKA
jgi:hypothetical protein